MVTLELWLNCGGPGVLFSYPRERSEPFLITIKTHFVNSRVSLELQVFRFQFSGCKPLLTQHLQRPLKCQSILSSRAGWAKQDANPLLREAAASPVCGDVYPLNLDPYVQFRWPLSLSCTFHVA